jgi:hypothetical protein
MLFQRFTIWTTAREAGCGTSRKASVALKSEEEEERAAESAMPQRKEDAEARS